MLKNRITEYFDGIEPDSELVERMVAVSKDTEKKRIKLSKKVIALIAAVVFLLAATSVTAAVVRVMNDDKGIVEITEFSDFSLQFSKAQKSPKKLSDTDSEIVKTLMDSGFKDVIIPGDLISGGYHIDNKIDFLPQYTSAMYDMSNDNGGSITITVIQDIAQDDIDGFWSTGDENSTGEIINVNGMDVVVTYMGDEQFGYSGFIFYANDNTIYQITYSAGLDEAAAKENITNFVKSLGEQ